MESTQDIPEDLADMLKAHDSYQTFLALRDKVRIQYLEWINEAKKEETRVKRIEHVAVKVAGR